MSSKAAYLSKYYSNEAGVSDDNDSQRRKANKKKSKKKKKGKRDTKKAEVLVHDEEEDNIATINKNSEPLANSDDEESDDDGEVPLVVIDSSRGYAPHKNDDVVEDEKNGIRRTPNDGRKTKQRRRRYDSDSESRSRGGNSISSRENRKRKRYDSDSSQHSTTEKKRHDSTSEDDDGRNGNNSKASRKRYDTDTDSDGGSRRGDERRTIDDESKTSDSDVDSCGRQRKMASGHAAGLQRAQDFSKAEQEIQAKRKLEASALVDQHGMGDTVYRDAQGRKQRQNPKQEDITKASTKEQQQQQQLFLLNQGKRQIQAQKEKQIYEEKLSQSGFARGVEDKDLEEWKKQQIRQGDPMAAKASVPKANNQQRGRSQKPTYKGPPAPPNRFQIRPGYRWDGNHRGNGFENKLLAKKYGQEMEKEKAYRWSTADM